MTEYWLALAIGASLGALLLALASLLPVREMAMQGFIALAVMLWIYVGAQLVGGTMSDILFEGLFALVVGGIAQFAMIKWPPSIGIAITLHGVYDAVLGPHTGVIDWYPPLCAGFDFVFGAGMYIVLRRRTKAAAT